VLRTSRAVSVWSSARTSLSCRATYGATCDVRSSSFYIPGGYYTLGRDGTRNAARRPGSGGRPSGCGFEEHGGGMCAYAEGGLSPIAILSVCLSVPLYSTLYFVYIRYYAGIYVRIDTSHHIPTVRPLPACLRRIAQAPNAVQSELKTSLPRQKR